DTCTTLCYIRRKIFGGIENCDLSLPLKKDLEPAIAMTANALLLAMCNPQNEMFSVLKTKRAKRQNKTSSETTFRFMILI
ncbi:hypothetical protein, partial [uncultured Duncaniella sp.]|uniref:hypothetical protein n=1 Tax=uncultured Duncaniella sp. TaxID=2768039 RepID=UPI00272B5DF2